MKKNYNVPEIAVEVIDNNDIIITSTGFGDDVNEVTKVWSDLEDC